MARSTGLALALSLWLVAGAQAAKLSLVAGGLQVDAGAMGTFVLDWPQLRLPGDKLAKPIEAKVNGDQATLRYAEGATIEVALPTAESASFKLTQRPAGVERLRFEGLLDFGLSEGGTWQANDHPAQPFPPQQPEKPFLYQDQATSITITDVQGRQLNFGLPAYSWVQIQDNREWGWKTFYWFVEAPIDGDGTAVLKVLERGTGDAAVKVLVDRFGQDARSDWPGKLHDEAELKTDAAAETTWSATLPKATDLDAYGGQEGSGQRLGLNKTGYFHTQQVAGRWYLVDPAGNAFFHLGLCCFGPGDDYTYVEGREGIYEWLPPYDSDYRSAYRPGDRTAFSFYLANVIRKTGQPFDQVAWSRATIDRVRGWGFNSVGAFSGVPHEALVEKSFPYVAHLPLDPWSVGIQRIPGLTETWDPFDEGNVAKVKAAFAEQLPKRASDPLLIGYFLINEPAYQDIPRVVPTLGAEHACKRALVEFLRGRYTTVADFNAAWGLQAPGFDALADQGLPVTTAVASADMQAYYEHFLETYFKLVGETYRQYDPNHLLLGNRYQSITINSEPLCRITAKWVDVMSFNYYTHHLDLDFLAKLHRWSGNKPLLLSEFHWASPPDSGLPGGARDVNSQVERGLAYRNYVEQAAASGFVVGTEWFTLIDQARSGRWFSKYSGENGNTGVLSVVDRPWRETLAGMAAAHADIYPIYEGAQRPFVWDNPRFAASGATAKVAKIMRATGPIALDGTTAGWPGLPAEEISDKRLVQGADAGGVSATFRTAWDDKNLYLLANVVDPTPQRNNQTGDSIWSADGLELFIGPEEPDKTGPLLFGDRQVLLSAGPRDGGQPAYYFANAPRQEELQLVSLPGPDGGSYVLQATIPWASLNISPQVGLRLRFDLAVDDSADGSQRLRQLMWSGTDRNSGDRSAWGTAILAE